MLQILRQIFTVKYRISLVNLMMSIASLLPNPSKTLEQKILDLLQLDEQLDRTIPRTIRQDLIYFL